MANPKGLFGLKIPAGGAIIPLDTFSDIRITNIAFGEELSGDARSVVKVHHAQMLEASEYDSEGDDDEDEDEEGEEDEEEDDDDDDVEAKVEVKANGIKSKKASKLAAAAAAAAAAEVEDEDDEDENSAEVSGSSEDDDDDEDSDDEDDHWVEEDFVLCSLYPGKKEQAVVDLAFCMGEEVGFSVSGENAVEITGYYLAPDPFEEMSDSDYDEYDEDDLDSDDLEALYGDVGESSIEEIDSDEEMDDDAQIEELDDEVKALPVKVIADAASAATKINSKKRSKQGEDDDDESVDEAVAEAAGDAVSQLTKNQRKKLNKKLKTEADSKNEKAEFANSKSTKAEKPKAKVMEEKSDKKEVKEAITKKTTLPSGLIIEEKSIGSGPKAKPGNKVGMRYVGRLLNGKQFDANNSGKPFMFKLGKGEVIAGWDEGVRGMQVGGQRRLTCPAKLAYGKQGAPPDIPPNSTLVFDVKLVEIK